MSNYRPSAYLREMHDQGRCLDDCPTCSAEQTFDPPEGREPRDFLTVDEYREDRYA